MTNNWPATQRPTNPPARQTTTISLIPEKKVFARVDKDARIEAYRDQKQTQLELHRQELRKQEMLQLVRNVNEVVECASERVSRERPTGTFVFDEVKVELIGQVVRTYVNVETTVYNANHNPLLGGFS